MLTERFLSDSVDRTAAVAERCLKSDALVDYEELDIQIRELDTLARESFQDAHRRLYESIAEKLESARQLSDLERSALELLIVGEAKYYLQAENNYQDWKTELQRLIGEMRKTVSEARTDAEKLLHIQALCHDAKGVLPDITFYLRERDRIERFREATTGDIHPDDGRFLAGIIRQMISSGRR